MKKTDTENETSYKDTLHLPKTEFPMKAALAEKEPSRIKFWQEMNLYAAMQQQRKNCPKFILNDGPPYANGDIHIGHAVNKILKDMVIKSKHLSGYCAPYVPGWDCHGLPIEIQVEKKIGKPGANMDSKTFRRHCREYAAKQIDIQRQSFIRLGVIGDWQRPYVTMDYKFEADTIRTLAKIIANGHLHKGDKPVHWCINCGSALAEAEVEYAEKTSPAIDVIFKATNPAALSKCFQQALTSDVGLVIWTTTPWTLPANQAVALHAKLTYLLVQIGSRHVVVAKDLLASFLARLGEDSSAKVLGSCEGAALESQQLQHPFYDRVVPIILAEHVTIETGTGCVHTAPAHGLDDYQACQKYQIAVNNQVDNRGRFVADALYVGGMDVFKANEVVLELLRERQALLTQHEIKHSYPHCWRHKTPLIFRATPQWFISMTKKELRANSLAAIQQVEWLPEWGQARITGMISSRPDWCISRQRTWGVPITLFVHKQTGELHPNTNALMEKVAILVEKLGVDAWYELEPAALLGKDAEQYEQVFDILDVWFDSGAVHACVAARRPELTDPVDLYLEGSDQHRGWFQTSLLSSVAINNSAPYKQVLTHGFTVDAAGRKMSKSLGNVIAPEQIIKTLGADVLRLWVAATDYRGEIYVSDEILKRTSDVYRRVRNTARFLMANLHDFDPQHNCVEYAAMLELDKWIIDRARQLQQIVLTAYQEYQFHVVVQKIHNFCVDDLGSFYLDVIKDRQYTGKKDGIPRRSAQTAIYHVAEAVVRLIAPILSFTAEEIWQLLPGKRAASVFLTDWYQDLTELSDDSKMNHEFWDKVLQVRSIVNREIEKIRDAGIVGSALEVTVDLYCDKSWYQLLNLLGKELRFIFITSSATVHNDYAIPADALITELDGLQLKLHKSKHQKCERCWHRSADVAADPQFPGLCKRCIANLGAGENRCYG